MPVWGASSGGSPSSGGGGPSDAFIISGNRGATSSNQIFNYAFTSSTESVWGTCEDDGSGGATSRCSNSSTTDGFYTTGTHYKINRDAGFTGHIKDKIYFEKLIDKPDYDKNRITWYSRGLQLRDKISDTQTHLYHM